MTNANEPAFPIAEDIGTVTHFGLTKREYFAAMAMQGLIANSGTYVIRDAEQVASMATEAADALIAELAKAEPEKAAPDAGWIDWGGGECPVEPDCRVKIQVRCGNTDTGEADCFYWPHDGSHADIMRYRFVKGGEA